MENCHNKTVAYFIKLEFITKLVWALYALIFTILDEDVVGANMGNCIGSDLGHFLGHGPSLVEVYVG